MSRRKMQQSCININFFIVLLMFRLGLSLEYPYNSQEMPCKSIIEYQTVPCYCSIDDENAILVNCNGVTFTNEFPILPHRHKIHSFSQSGSGLQSLEAQLFTASNIPLQTLDFSHNLLRRVTERSLEGIGNTLKELKLNDNKLGDQLNYLFSTNEFHHLISLSRLDLSRNEIKGLQSSVFSGLSNLQVLHLEDNELMKIPVEALRGLDSLNSLHLEKNYIFSIGQNAFPVLTKLHLVNLSSNAISHIEDTAFSNVPNLKTLIISDNQLYALNSKSLSGLALLEYLDLSQNFIDSFSESLFTNILSLKVLILHSNKIRSLNKLNLNAIASLEILDISRNRIFEIAPNSFVGLKNLKELHIDVNTVRKITHEMFQDLENLSDLTLKDNRILAFPTEPLTIFKKLRKLNLDYNRIAAVSKEILAPIKENEELSIAFNLISEIQDDTFVEFKNLQLLNLHGNKISNFSENKTKGIEDSLLYLDIGYNEITELPVFRFSKLLILSLAKNNISSISQKNIEQLTAMKYFNVSYNGISTLPSDFITKLVNLESLDMQNNVIKSLPYGVFSNLSIIHINLKNNRIEEISERTFEFLSNLKELDLSYNMLKNIASNAFYSVPNLETLNLIHNNLTIINTGIISSSSQLTQLKLSYNQISYLSSDAFSSYPNLKYLSLRYNKLTILPVELIAANVLLQEINLEGNMLSVLSDRYFANMPQLRHVNLKNNVITAINEFVFQNSSNLYSINLQNNMLSSLPEKTFEGLTRLNLDVSQNNFISFPEEIFSREKGLKLESINLAFNNFRDFPSLALKRQYSFLEKANFSFNKISILPSNVDVLVNIKELDISHNPLSIDAHHTLFGEPKSARKLYADSIGIASLPIIEIPFLRKLSLRGNKLSDFQNNVFRRTNALTDLDLSQNAFQNFNVHLSPALASLKNLRKLDVSGNPVHYMSSTDFDMLQQLQTLNISNLPYVTDIKCSNVSNLPYLRSFSMYGFPTLSYLHIKQCLQNFVSLQHLAIEIKDTHLKDQLQTLYSSKLNDITVTGEKLKTISSSAFAGMVSSTLKISLRDTSIDGFTDKVFLPLPLSSKIEFHIFHNAIRSLTPDMLSVLENKQINIAMYGISTNPITCDCHMISLWNWIQEKLKNVGNRNKGLELALNLKCVEPLAFKGKLLVNLKQDDFICYNSSSDMTQQTMTSASLPRSSTTRQDNPYIIFEPPVTKKPSMPQSYIPTTSNRNALTKVDTMIIGIVAGVVAFVCILIVIICIIRLRRAHPHYTAGPLAGPLAFRAQGKCTCLKPPSNNCTCYPMYPVPYPYAASHPGSSLHHKSLPPCGPPPPAMMNTAGQSGRQRPSSYYVTYPESDNGK